MSKSVQKMSWRLAFLAALVIAASINVAQAKNIKKQNLVELMTHSDSIVVGTVKSTTDGFQGGLPYTEVTVLVAQGIKGDFQSTYTFRQFGLKEPKANGNGQVNLMVTPAGWPTYVEGERVMLFLHKPAAKTGFQTTAGLTQGKFTIRGQEIANGIGNDELFARMTVSGPLTPTQQDLVNQPGGAYAAQAFIELVRKAVDENWIETGQMTNAQK
ncbi:MAG: hypothetical protein QNI96_07520 [Woeseiaceae bacterium]|nr:hypothetical protein [Woeseiaceae bacterium]